MLRVELRDGRVLAFGGVSVVGFNLAEAQRHARRGTRIRQRATDDAIAVVRALRPDLIAPDLILE